MNTNNCKTCSSCGRSWEINTCPAQCTCGINLRNYDYTLPACIRNKKPSCDKKAIIASTTVETTSKMEGIRDAFVHVTENNTTYYLDSCGNPIITWAGPIDMPRYDVDNNPFGYKKQLLHTVRTTTNPVTGEDEDDDVVVYYDSRGDAHVLMTEDDITRMFEYIQNEEAQLWAAIDTKQDTLTAGANITIRKDPDTGETIISATGGGAAGDPYIVEIIPISVSGDINWSSVYSYSELAANLDKIVFKIHEGSESMFLTPTSIVESGSMISAKIAGEVMMSMGTPQSSEYDILLNSNRTGTFNERHISLQSELTAGQDITIDSNNVISAIVDLTNYYNKAEVNQLISDLDSISMRVVATLPTTGVSNIIYLVQRTGETVYDQWVYSEGQWYHIGDTNIDLSEYYTKLEADAKFQEILSEGNNIDPVTDSTELSSVDLSNKVVDKVAVSDLWDYMWKKIYPVGSIYTTVTNDDPATLFGGTWEIVGNGRVLWGVGSGDTAGTTLAEQLPNIKGQLNFSTGSQGHPEFTVSGAFARQGSGSYSYPDPVGSSTSGRIADFNATRSSSVYTDNGIVRPNAYTVKFWRRTA